MEIKKIAGELAVSKVPDFSKVDLTQPFTFIGNTDEEISVVSPVEKVPENAMIVDRGWRAFRIQGQLDFTLVGILAKIATLLAEHEISIFAVSTYNTDYVLVKQEKFADALKYLGEAGYDLV